MPRVTRAQAGCMGTMSSSRVTRGARDRAHPFPNHANAAAGAAGAAAVAVGTMAACVSPVGEPTTPIYPCDDDLLSDDVFSFSYSPAPPITVSSSSSGSSKRQREVDAKDSVGEEDGHDNDATTNEEQDLERSLSSVPVHASGSSNDGSLRLLKRSRTRSADSDKVNGMAQSPPPVLGLWFTPHTPEPPPTEDCGFSPSELGGTTSSPENSPSFSSPHDSRSFMALDEQTIRRVTMGLAEDEYIERYTPQGLILACRQLFSIADGGDTGPRVEIDNVSSCRSSSSSGSSGRRSKRRLLEEDGEFEHDTIGQDDMEPSPSPASALCGNTNNNNDAAGGWARLLRTPAPTRTGINAHIDYRFTSPCLEDSPPYNPSIPTSEQDSPVVPPTPPLYTPPDSPGYPVMSNGWDARRSPSTGKDPSRPHLDWLAKSREFVSCGVMGTEGPDARESKRSRFERAMQREDRDDGTAAQGHLSKRTRL